MIQKGVLNPGQVPPLYQRHVSILSVIPQVGFEYIFLLKNDVTFYLKKWVIKKHSHYIWIQDDSMTYTKWQNSSGKNWLRCFPKKTSMISFAIQNKKWWKKSFFWCYTKAGKFSFLRENEKHVFEKIENCIFILGQKRREKNIHMGETIMWQYDNPL